MGKEEAILLYDGECNLCDSLVSFIIRHDRKQKFMFSPLQSETGKELLSLQGISGRQLNSVVYISHQRFFFRSDAVLNIFRDLGGGWRLLYGFRFIPPFIRDIFYFIVARTRYRIFGKRVLCPVP